MRMTEAIAGLYRVGGFETSGHVLTSQNSKKKSLINIISVPFILRIFVSIFFTICFFLFPYQISNEILNQPDLEPFIKILGIYCFLISIDTLIESFLKGLSLFKEISIFQFLCAILMLIIVPISTMRFGLVGAIFSMTCIQLLRVLGQVFILIKDLKGKKLRLKIKRFFYYLFMHLKLGVPVSIPILVAAPTLTYLYSLLSSAESLDAFAQLRVIVAFAFFLTVIPNALLPVFVTAMSNSDDNRDAFLINNFKFIFFVSLICAILVICILPEFNMLVFGKDYILATTGFLIYLHTIILINMTNFFSSHFVSIKKPSVIMLSNLILCFVFLIAGYFLIKSYGLYGFLYAELVAHIFMLMIFVLFAIKEVKNKNLLISIILKMLLIYALFTFFIIFVANIDDMLQRISIALFLTLVLGLLTLITLFSPEDIKKIRSLIPI